MPEGILGIPYSETNIVHPINPETAAHNIALAYIQSAFNEKAFHLSDDVNCETVFTISDVYAQAYNYAYNYIVHENEIINSAE